MANRVEFDFPMFDKLKKQLDEIGGNALDIAVEKALIESHNYVTQQLEAAISPHRRTGKTAGTLDKIPDVIKDGTTYYTDVGFDIGKGGLPSIFLMYGTTVHGQPHIAPDRNLFDAIYGNATKKKIQEIQENAFFKVIDEVMKK